METVEQLLEEEKQLIEQAYGTPLDESGNPSGATPSSTEGQPSPTSQEGLPSPKGKSGEPEEDYEKRFKNLRASRDTNLYEAKKQLEAKDDAIAELQVRLSDLEAKLNKPKEVKATEILTKEEQEFLGDETLNAVEKVTKTLTDSRVTPLQDELNSLKEKAKKAEENQRVQGKKDLYNSFLTRLRSAVPELDSINTDKAFIKYLGGNDIDGTTRFDNFKKAEQRGDVTTVARYMLDFKNLKGSDRLAKKITPTSTKGSPKVGDESVPMTMAQVNQIYDDFAKGRYRGKEDEFHKLEQKIDLLASQGKIR